MATRTERAEEAIALVEGREELLWALAINESPVRRTYLSFVSGVEGRPLVRTLARMANAGILEETEGLEFRIDRKAFADELRQRVPEESALRLHERSLEWCSELDRPRPSFELHHLVGAGRWTEAADRIVELLEAKRSEQDGPDRRLLRRARGVAFGLLESPEENRDRALRLGVLVLEDGRSVLKPSEIKALLDTLRGLAAEDEALLARLDAVETGAKGEAKARRAARRAAREGASEPEASPGATESSGDAERRSAEEAAAG